MMVSLPLVLLLLPTITNAQTYGYETYGYETTLFHCTPGSTQQQWKVINGRARQRRTDLCLTIDSCQEPSGPEGRDNAAVMEHCAKGCWADTMINRVSQQWELPSVTDGAGRVRSRAMLDVGAEEDEPLCLSYGTPSSGADDPRVLVEPCSNATDWRYDPIAGGGNSDYHLLQIVFPAGVDNSTGCIGGPPCCLGTRNLGRSAGLHAMLAQFLAAAALPLGAMLGVVAAPVRQETIAALNAFGAGALVFSLSVQVYGEILLSLGDKSTGTVQVTLALACTVLGAVLYNFFSHKLRETVQPFKPGVQGVAGASLQSEGDGGSGLNAPLLSSSDSPAEGLSDTGDEDEDDDDDDDDDDEQDEERAAGDDEVARAAQAGAGPTPTAVDDATNWSPDAPAGGATAVSSIMAAERHLAALLWLSCWVDLVPQAVLFGLLAGERVLHASLVIACALANLPQAFSSAVRQPARHTHASPLPPKLVCKCECDRNCSYCGGRVTTCPSECINACVACTHAGGPA